MITYLTWVLKTMELVLVSVVLKPTLVRLCCILSTIKHASSVDDVPGSGCTAPNHMTARSELEVHREIYKE